MNKDQIWQAALGELELTLTPANFKTFLAGSKLTNASQDTLEITCPNLISKRRMEDRYYQDLKAVLTKLTQRPIKKLNFTVHAAPITTTKTEDLGPLFSPEKIKTQARRTSGLSPDYTFDSYVVGPNNKLAHAVALAIVDNPGQTYNPFFLYSSVGLGKTHLIQAIGNAILARYTEKKAIYCTGESFTNELLESIQQGQRGAAIRFRSKFRQADILLIDDIQFIAGRESTQEEFFHTFNALYLAKKQVVLTSDRPPKDISKLEGRLSSRFGSGITADMQTPDRDVRNVILRKKSFRLGVAIPEEILDRIAQKITTNIRDLEAALNQVVAHTQTTNQPLTGELVDQILKSNYPDPQRPVGLSEIIREVAAYYQLKPKDLKGKARPQQVALARQIAMYLMRDLTEISLMAVGAMLGGRDHTTIMHGVAKIENLHQKDDKIRQDIFNLKRSLGVI